MRPLSLAVTLGVLALPGPAVAAPIHIGELPPSPPSSLCSGGTLTQLEQDPARPSYVAPIDGVITRWRINEGGDTGTEKLKVFRPTADPLIFRVVGESDEETVAANTLNSYATSVPVNAGDRIGHKVMTGSTNCLFTTSAADTFGVGLGGSADPAPGTDVTFVGGNAGRLNLDALMEPDNDGDGVPDDSADADDDNDGVGDGQDNCPLAANQGQRNSDGTGDGGDACDADDDNDGARDEADNCVTVVNADQSDADLGGGGDACDEDDDNDGLSDSAEVARRTSAIDADSDDDGLGDAAERSTNPARADSDRDRLPDGLELGRRRGVPDPPGTAEGTNPARFRADRDPRSKTNPLKRDSDRDRLRDGREDRNRNGRRDRRETDPRKRDTDRDRVIDGRDRKPLDRRIS